MSVKFWIFPIIILFLFSCSRNETPSPEDELEEVLTAPLLTTSELTDISQQGATGGGDVTSDGGSTVTSKGICWGTEQNPTVNDNKLENGLGTGEFISVLANLEENSSYFVRAYATNASGTGYGNEVAFRTLALPDKVYEGDLVLGTQIEVDDFGKNNFTSITGDLQIGLGINSAPDVENLDLLGSLKSIGGSFSLLTTSITDVEGLRNLSFIGGDVALLENPGLSSLNPFKELTTINGNLILSLINLTNLKGLHNIKNITGDLVLLGNYRLTSTSDMVELSIVGGDIRITSNYELIDINVLDIITSVTGDLVLINNFRLLNLNGLSNITSIDGNLEISKNYSLPDLDGLINLKRIGGTLRIDANSLSTYSLGITDLDGLGKLELLEGNVIITNNNELADICGLQLLMSSGFSGDYIVRQNEFNPTQQNILDGVCSK